MENGSYHTPFSFGEAAFTEKRSSFTGRIWPVKTGAEAVSIIEDIRARCRDATHNVYAYIIKDEGIVRYSDDGEPQGTGGLPLVELLRREQLTDVLCVVTRYFGGTLLGTGGLARAYTYAAKIALEEAGVALMSRCDVITLHYEYAMHASVLAIIESVGGSVEHTEYTSEIQLRALTPASASESLIKKLLDATGGKVTPDFTGARYAGTRIK